MPMDRTPWTRAVLRDGRMTLNAWSPLLITGGPQRAVLERLADGGAVVADLYEHAGETALELIVEWVFAGAGGAAAEAVLLAWAADVGYGRVWLPGRVVDLDVVPAAAGRAG